MTLIAKSRSAAGQDLLDPGGDLQVLAGGDHEGADTGLAGSDVGVGCAPALSRSSMRTPRWAADVGQGVAGGRDGPPRPGNVLVGRGFTLLFEVAMLTYAKQMPIAPLAQLARAHDTRI